MRSRNRTALGSIAVGAFLLLAPTADAVDYCTTFNSAYLTDILTNSGALCPTDAPCNFYSQDFADAREDCGDELFRVRGSNGEIATCDFCFWSRCLSFYNNEFGIVALDEVEPLESSAGFRMRVLTAPGAQTIFRGGPGGDQSYPAPNSTHAVTLEAGRDYLFYLVRDATRTQAMLDPAIDLFYSVAGANPDPYDHLVSLQSRQNDNATAFGWEDTRITDWNFDDDLNDVVFTTRCDFRMRPSRLPRKPSSPAAPLSE